MLQEEINQENDGEIRQKNDKNLISRKIYFFTCEKCGHIKRQSFRKNKAEVGLCRNCRQATLLIHKNQGNLFANLDKETIYEPSGSIPQ